MIRSELYIYDSTFFDNTKIHVHFKETLRSFCYTSNNREYVTRFDPFVFSSFAFYLVHSSLDLRGSFYARPENIFSCKF